MNSRTPALERLLGALSARLRRKILLHGSGTFLFVVAAWLVFAFLADWGLRVPHGVRLLHGLVLVGLSAFFLWRDLLRPWLRVPGRDGLAVLLERAHPELGELLVSAVQFQERGAPDASPELVAAVIRQAEAKAGELDVSGVLDDKRPRQRFVFGSAAASLVALFFLANPTLRAVFFDRLLGGTSPWPQRTHLALEIRDMGDGARIEATPELILVRVARGTDIPVIVRAAGERPDEVMLHFSKSRDLVLNESGSGVYRTLLRSLQEDIVFWATGGDDLDGLPRVEVTVLQPPDVEGVAMTVFPPAYSGLEETTVFDQDVEVLANSRVQIHMLPYPADASGVARLLPDDREIALEDAPFPLDPSRSDGPLEGLRTGKTFELLASKSQGFRFELLDRTGLTNPDPGLFRIRVVEDRTPDVQILSPRRSDFEVVIGGAIPLRARAEDDFGLASMSWIARLSGGREENATEPTQGGALAWRLVEKDREDKRSNDVLGVGSVRIEVDQLGTPASPVAVDQRFEFVVTADDNRVPEANRGQTIPIRARVVTPGELLRRMQERLGQARLAASRLSDLERERLTRTKDLLQALESDGSELEALGPALSDASSRERRLLSDAQALSRDLAAVAEDILYARLDDKAGALLEFYEREQAEVVDARFRPEPMRALAKAGREGLGAGSFAGTLVKLVDLALEISQDHTIAAIRALSEAERAVELEAAQSALFAALDAQTAADKRTEDLLDELAEWDNFQNILALTRDILNRQKALRDRTQQFATDK